ncbi:putative integral inner membrane protein [Carnobacterium sp. 17-4]|uniref:FUSC family protein n=1 Tax=Carnobacterium sp. (strain 17-4) TaxID=208596 RepID=UPI0002059342|nr:FUSC family protein [Carnobacterium sp. 17-4]AEB30403.1 putative integral inner membrane protein [Carnobacterium sp. 17-4]
MRVLGAGMSVAIPLLIGYVVGNMKIGTFGSFGAFAFISYQPLPLKKLGLRIAKAGAAILVALYVGMIATLLPWTIPIVIGLVSLCGFLTVRILHIPNPGAFFVIMVCIMGTGTTVAFKDMFTTVGYASIGVAAAILVALLVGFINQNFFHIPTYDVTATKQELFLESIENDSILLLSSVHHAAIIFFSAYISQSLGFGNAYWITISCAAVLQGRNLGMVFNRNIQRIIGGFIGLLIGGFFLSLHLPTIQVVCLIILLNILVEYCMVRNYGLANFFTNPQALLLSNLSKAQFTLDLVQFRLAGLVIGSLIGLLGALVITYAIKLYDKEAQLIKYKNN